MEKVDELPVLELQGRTAPLVLDLLTDTKPRL